MSSRSTLPYPKNPVLQSLPSLITSPGHQFQNVHRMNKQHFFKKKQPFNFYCGWVHTHRLFLSFCKSNKLKWKTFVDHRSSSSGRVLPPSIISKMFFSQIIWRNGDESISVQANMKFPKGSSITCYHLGWALIGSAHFTCIHPTYLLNKTSPQNSSQCNQWNNKTIK